MEQCRIDKKCVFSALMSVRGNTRVTTDSPEGTYDALKKYGTDLVEQARKQKLDPRNRAGYGNQKCHPYSVSKKQEQPGADRRAWGR